MALRGLEEQLQPCSRISLSFENLQAELCEQREREASQVLSRRLDCLRTVSEAQASLGRFLDRRTASVRDASCAASDAMGRLQRLSEQSRTVRAKALQKAQAQLKAAEQRAAQVTRLLRHTSHASLLRLHINIIL